VLWSKTYNLRFHAYLFFSPGEPLLLVRHVHPLLLLLVGVLLVGSVVLVPFVLFFFSPPTRSRPAGQHELTARAGEARRSRHPSRPVFR
jgi:hypothetical protein